MKHKEVYSILATSIIIMILLTLISFILNLGINEFINFQMNNANINPLMITISSTIIGFALTVLTIFGVSNTPIMKKLDDNNYKKTKELFFEYTSLTIYVSIITIICSLFQKILSAYYLFFNTVYLTIVIMDIGYFIFFILITLNMYKANQKILKEEKSDNDHIREFLFKIHETEKKQNEMIKELKSKIENKTF